MKISTSISLKTPEELSPQTPSLTNFMCSRSAFLRPNDFLTPTLVSIGIEIGAVGFLIALLLLISAGFGDGGGSGGGRSGGEGTGEFAAIGSGSGSLEDDNDRPDETSERSSDITEVKISSDSSRPQQPAPLPAQRTETPITPPDAKPNIFYVQDLQQPPAVTVPEGAGGGNGFSDLEDRLRKAGAKTGDVQISLAWNNGNDLDLHVDTPTSEKIWYNHRNSSCGGELDVDMNAGGPASQKPVENVYWPVGESPSGKFRIMVHHYANHGGRDPTGFQVTIKVKERTQSFSGSLRPGDPPKMVHEFTFP